ncbi:phage scaffolding protein [Clostridioides difficile]
MKREFLKSLGLEDEIIEKIMSENGRDIEKYKKEVEKKKEELESKETELETVNKKVSELEKFDIESIKKEASDWKSKAEQAQKDKELVESQMSEQTYNLNLDNYLSSFKFSSNLSKEAVKIKMKEKGLEYKDGAFKGADDYMKELQTSDPGAFVGGNEIPKIVSTSGGNAGSNKINIIDEMIAENKKNAL